eukprot:g1885.t1
MGIVHAAVARALASALHLDLSIPAERLFSTADLPDQPCDDDPDGALAALPIHSTKMQSVKDAIYETYQEEGDSSSGESLQVSCASVVSARGCGFDIGSVIAPALAPSSALATALPAGLHVSELCPKSCNSCHRMATAGVGVASSGRSGTHLSTSRVLELQTQSAWFKGFQNLDTDRSKWIATGLDVSFTLDVQAAAEAAAKQAKGGGGAATREAAEKIVARTLKVLGGGK